ncbi:MAG: hypothetical protein IKF72_05180 [Kiritimatiellae bacterium]|nr:hypothetical protein [Kiritimatiellia bacterium]
MNKLAMTMAALGALAAVADGGTAAAQDDVEMLPSAFDGKTPVVVETDAFKLVINPDATARSLVIKATGEECLAPEAGLPVFASVQKRPFNNETRLVQMAKRTMYPANRVRRDGDILRIGFDTAPYEVEVRVRERTGYAAFEIVRFISNTVQEKQYGGLEPWKLDVPPIEEFRLLQLPVVERKNFGDWLNVEWDDHAAVAVVGATPYMDVDHERRGRWRLMRADALSGIGHGITNGVAVIAAGTGKDDLLAQIAAMENDYDLPRGVESRRNPLLNASIYWTRDLSVYNVDEHIANMKKGGFRMALFYSTGMFLNERAYTHYGNYDLDPEKFPNGYDDLRAVLGKIRAAGVAPGFHALQTFIGFKSRYVTPEADPRLSVKHYFALERPLPANGETCDVYVAQNPIDAPMHPMCRILKFGTELMHYEGYVTTPPYRFTGVKRGWFGTTVKEHGRGYFGGILDVCECTATSCCIDQNTSLQDEIGDKIAKVFDCGMEFLYFDGSEDVNVPCNVNISLSQWKVARRCGKMPLFTEGCAKTHFGWHLQSGANAFDVFSPEVFKEKIIEYPYQAAMRLAKDFTRVDFGWWKVFPETQPDMWEYGTSKAAAFDCPATMQMNLHRVRANGRMDDLFETVRRWEDVRARKWLTPDQKEMLKDPKREFHLYLNETNGYELVEWKQLDVAGGKRTDVRAFLFELNGRRVVAYWHVRDRARLVFAEPLDGTAFLDAAGMKYFETSLPAETVRAAFAAAAIREIPSDRRIAETVETGDLEVPARHVPKRIMGRDYWPALYKYRDWLPGAKYDNSAFEVRFDNPDIFKMPAFRDAAPVYWARNEPPPIDGASGTWRHFADNFTSGERDREIIDSNPLPDRPFLFAATAKRKFWTWGAECDLDYDEYAEWKAKHPNILYDGTILEWDNDLMLAYRRVKGLTNEVRRAKVEALIGKNPPKTRDERMDVMRRHYADRHKAAYGGKMAVHASHVFSQHLGADCGADVLAVETTNSSGSPTSDSEYRWNLAPMFVRGAARQFDRPWEWYWAAYMNGFRTNGEWHNNAACRYPAGPSSKNAAGTTCSPEYGVSGNLMRRLYYFSYLTGANVTQPEEWSAYFLAWDDNAGKTVLTYRGRDYAAYHDFTVRHPGRGVPYTPVAICIPLSRGYPAYGGWPWAEKSYGYTRSDLMSDAVLFSLIPGFERAKAMKAGVETNLHNSRFAQMYDVICPDAPSQSAETVLDVMESYKALVVAGEFAGPKAARCLAEYEKSGGRVIQVSTTEYTEQTENGWLGNSVRSVPSVVNLMPKLKAGKIRFPEVESILENLQNDYFPFKVEGDCLYGANRTADGWWLWVFNNKGVAKFTDAPHTVDNSFDAYVKVSCEKGNVTAAKELVTDKPVPIEGGTFKHRIAAGDLAVFELTKPQSSPPGDIRRRHR